MRTPTLWVLHTILWAIDCSFFLLVIWLGFLFIHAFQRWMQSTGLNAMWHLNRQVTITPLCIRADSLGKPLFVVRRNSPGQGYVMYSGVDRCVTTWIRSSVACMALDPVCVSTGGTDTAHLRQVSQEGLLLILEASCWPAKRWYLSMMTLQSGLLWCLHQGCLHTPRGTWQCHGHCLEGCL